jgi:hypothetical protein
MHSHKYNTFSVIIIIVLSFSWQNSFAQKIIKLDSPSQTLQHRWQRGVKQVGEETAWIGYSINRLMSKNSYIGNHHSNKNGPVLEDIISGKVNIKSVKGNTVKHKGFHWDDGESVEKEMKEVAILFRVSGTSGSPEYREISMSNLSLYFDLGGYSLYWLGAADYEESINLLKKIYNQTGDHEVKEDIITAVGIHTNSQDGYDFLHDLIFGNEDEEIREDAVFWIAQYDKPEVVDLMKKIAWEDESEDVREKAVFGLYIIDTDEAADALIDLARHSENIHIREKAIFWLGQTASKKAVDALDETVYDEDETEVQEQAVFAISQLDAEDSVPRLIKIAESHPNPEIRKKAIFWLGQTDDDRALDAIIGFLKK